MQGFLNDQFVELEKLEDDRDNPAFVESMVNLFLSQTPDEITCIEQALEETPLDLVELNRCIYKFKGSIVSIGAKRVDAEIVKMLACLREDAIDIGGCCDLKIYLPSRMTLTPQKMKERPQAETRKKLDQSRR
ncbi:histidine-containing phosphotransfer protein 4-like [Juglans microcarpa x Juglans regia]|uniref:histidine-containing phosphotransfer protein 4-like n=1 Tax=Juglans microcarpa x Juglans regia TaxID=2249226 RepID=UPI001B7DCEBD|nr:histidine-containing phosphotransfer protein 4-like [Juglans microcarpa x Juglans regia]